jgi:regulator of ribonuclease activity B
MKLIVNYGDFEFTDFNKAVHTLSSEYGYSGKAWNAVVSRGDLNALCDFLNDDGIDAEIVLD